MSGSSARKLKYGGANLLAGRAFVYSLFPVTYFEAKDHFQLNDVFNWMFTFCLFFATKKEKRTVFTSFAQTYLKEEIWMEQLVRKLNPFENFLRYQPKAMEKIINYTNIARDVGIDDKTVKQYFFRFRKDTLVGFFLEPFQHSFRKRLSLKPKFYYFDTGVVRALSRQLSVPLVPSTSAYGEALSTL